MVPSRLTGFALLVALPSARAIAAARALCCSDYDFPGLPPPCSTGGLIDVPTFIINVHEETDALETMRARVCPLLAGGACAHRVSAVTPAAIAHSGYSYVAPANAPRSARLEVAISLSHLLAVHYAQSLYPREPLILVLEVSPRAGCEQRSARVICGMCIPDAQASPTNASAAHVPDHHPLHPFLPPPCPDPHTPPRLQPGCPSQDDMQFELLPLRQHAAAAWPKAGKSLRELGHTLPRGWCLAQLQTLLRTAFLTKLRSEWERFGRPSALPMGITDSSPRGCEMRCCMQHNAMGTGAYLLSATGRDQLAAWWPLNTTHDDTPPRLSDWRGPVGRVPDEQEFTVKDARACWSIPEDGCQPWRRGEHWPRLKPQLVSDHCITRPDKYGPPMTAEEATDMWRANRTRAFGKERRAWRSYVVTPPIVLGDTSSYEQPADDAVFERYFWPVAVTEQANETSARVRWRRPARATATEAGTRLHGKSAWLQLNLERGAAFARKWWEEIGREADEAEPAAD
jgi:hypothetical protein